jgi:NAD+ diphosphatase
MQNLSQAPAVAVRGGTMTQAAFCGTWDTRAADRRADPALIAALRARTDARVLPVWRGKPHLGADGLGWVGPDHPCLIHAGQDWIYLGQWQDRPCFAADISGWEPDAIDRAALAMFLDPSQQIWPGAEPGQHFGELRLAMATLGAAEAALASTARAVFNWHRSHRFCAACGAGSAVAAAGWERVCPACGAKHFPRTDPVVIMLVLHGNRALLGRQAAWPATMYSALAGFIEPGETMEAAVRREVAEEVGLSLGDVRYVASQPWPFPNSLMLGCVAEALEDTITLDAELEDARWFSREQVLRAWSGEDQSLMPARKGAIAHGLIAEWLAGRLD